MALLLLLPMVVVGQSRQPLIPSARNDRRMAEERMRQEQAGRQQPPADNQQTNNNTNKPASDNRPQTAVSEQIGDGTQTANADGVQTFDPDSAKMAETKVKQLGAENYEELTQPQSSMDLQDPSNVKTEVIYDPVTGGYILHTKIGDTDVATPYLMNEQEYKDYSERELMHRYWQQKISEVDHNNEKKFDITDMKFNIGPADKIFGPGGVQLKLQGSAELLFGFKHQFIDNPSLTPRARNNNIFDFDEKIQVNVNGKVGDKLSFTLNYNTEASFSFDQQNLKLQYKGHEDDIIQSIEAGNVSMDLNSSLIRGTQALFGFKTTLKFGKLKIQGLISQQNSQSQTVNSQGGAQMTKFEIDADKYDENRHFFLSYFFRDQYERAMESLPYIASGVTINKIEVWVTNKRGNYDQARNIAAFVDLGETGTHVFNPAWVATGNVPHNNANTLYSTITGIAGIRDIQQVSSLLQGVLESGDEYEKIESARLLTSSEYTLNSALGYISLKSALNQDEVLAVAYEFTYGGQVYQVGEFSTDTGEDLKAPATLMLKMLKSSINAPHDRNLAREGEKYGTWDLMMKNIYHLGATTISSEKFELYINYRNDSIGTDIQYLSESQIKGKQLLRVLQLDRLDSRNNPAPDGKFDYVEGYTVLSGSGRIIFPVLEPFGSYLKQQIGDPKIAEQYIFQELYDSTLVIAQEMTEKNKFTLKGKYKGTNGSQISLGAMNVPRGSVTVTAGGAKLIENVDYTVDYTMGTVTILNESILESGTNVECKLENQSTFSMQRKSLFGVHLEYEFTKDLVVGGTLMHLREKPLTTKVNTGHEPLANTIWGVNASWKTEMQWLSNAIDKIPWITATAPSTFQVSAEFAHLIPGHTRDVGSAGTAYIDDFESTKVNIDVHFPNNWFLASTPYDPSSSRQFNNEDAKLSNDPRYNRNRALLNWFHVDPIFGYPQTNTPAHIKDDLEALSDHRTRIVLQDEIYPTKGQAASNEDIRLSLLNLSYYPEERGPYNINASEINSDGKLTNPRQRWGGIMRKLDNTDFEKANIEYIEFWLMDPALTNPEGFDGELYINLGDISEDILRDGKKSFEHGLPVSN
ncbi:MAG: cell surface protein SprA, partial [Paludibacteraceae bacterium]|nr:cell surface protein SprA [Paludibacteraceae bacterium]